MEEWGSALASLGVGGVGLYLFAQGKLLSQAAVATLVGLFDARIAEWRDRYEEMRDDRDAWRELALGNERSLDLARPIVAKAAGVPAPPLPTTGQYTAADQARGRRGGRQQRQ